MEARHRAAAIGGQTLKDGGELQRTMTHRAFRDRVEVGSIQPYAGVLLARPWKIALFEAASYWQWIVGALAIAIATVVR